MKTNIPLLQNVRVAAPCHAAWDGMQEVDGDRVHFCDQCQKRVYNLSAMGQAEAEGLLRKHEGHLCVRYFRRADGTILTTDCPVGLKAARALAFQRARASFAACLIFCIGFAAYRAGQPVSLIGDVEPEVSGEAIGQRIPVTPEPAWTTGSPAPVMGVVPALPLEEVKGDINMDAEMGETLPPRHERTEETVEKPNSSSKEIAPDITEELEGIRIAR